MTMTMTTTTTPSDPSPGHVATAMTCAYFTGQVTEYKRLALTCPNPDGVMGVLLKDKGVLFRALPWEDSQTLVARCRDPYNLGRVLHDGATRGNVPQLTSVIWRVDVTSAYAYPLQKPVLTCALYGTIHFPSRNGMQVLRTLVTTGVSALDRNTERNERQCLLRGILVFCGEIDARLKLPIDVAEATRLLLRAGAVSHSALHGLREDKHLQRVMGEESKTAASMKRCYRDVVRAASTPGSLLHLARLAASAAVGCRPGRPARIESLPLPAPLKDALRFKDVTDDFVKHEEGDTGQ